MKRRRFSSDFKTKVVLEALSERYTMSEFAERHGLHLNQISQWKAHFKENASHVFEKGGSSTKKSEVETERDRLMKAIGELKVENDFLKKVLS
jgi:transposase